MKRLVKKADNLKITHGPLHLLEIPDWIELSNDYEYYLAQLFDNYVKKFNGLSIMGSIKEVPDDGLAKEIAQYFKLIRKNLMNKIEYVLNYTDFVPKVIAMIKTLQYLGIDDSTIKNWSLHYIDGRPEKKKEATINYVRNNFPDFIGYFEK